jgi:hypothetical protein
MRLLRIAAPLLLAVMLFFPSTASGQNGPKCDGVFHWVYVAGAENLDGSETGFEYLCQTGSATGPLLFYLQGGGACWTGDNCDCQPNSGGVCTNPNSTNFYGFFNQSTSDDGLPWAQTYWGGGVGAGNPQVSTPGARAAAFAGPTSPFNQNWNIVYIPHTTGDAFMGDTLQKLTTRGGKTYTAHFRGYRNVRNDLTVIASLFPNPSKIAIWGISGGGVGADCNLSQFQRRWSTTSMWEMSDAGPAYGTNDIMPYLPTITHTWGVWELSQGGAIVENTCPIVAQAGSTDWNLEWVVRYNADNFPNVRKALTDDYSDFAVSQFACLFGATPDPNGTCAGAVASTLTDEFNDVISGATNYRVFYHTGTCHSSRELDGNSHSNGGKPSWDFDNMQQSGVNFNDWVNAWINDSPAWVNVR